MTATFKICSTCTSAHQKPVSLSKRKCSVCGGNKFRSPTCEEIAREDHMIELMKKFEAEVLGGE